MTEIKVIGKCIPRLIDVEHADIQSTLYTVLLSCWYSINELACMQVPDFTSQLTNEVEGQQFLAATGAALPDAAIRTAADRKGPVGKVFLFTTKHEVPGIYKALAMQFHGKARLLFCWTTPDNKGPGYPLMQKMNVSELHYERLA